jgi:drug/metabolite transporter (DMT)-like permease
VISLLGVVARRQVVSDWPVLKTRLPYLIGLGVIGLTAFNAIMYVAAYTTSGVNLTIIQGAIPVFVLIGAYAAYRTPIRLVQGIGVLLTIVGLAVIASNGAWSNLLDLKFAIGDLLMILASAFYASYTVAVQRRPPVSGLALFTILAAIACLAGLPLLVAEILAGQAYWPTATGWMVLAYVAIFPSLMAQLFYLRGIELIGPGRAGIFVNLVPVFGSALSVAILGEPIGWHQVIALVLVLVGIAWAQKR